MASPVIEVTFGPEDVQVSRYRGSELWLKGHFKTGEYCKALLPPSWSGLLPPGVISINSDLTKIALVEQASYKLIRVTSTPFPGLYRIFMPPLLYGIAKFSSGGYQVESVLALSSSDIGRATVTTPPIPNLYASGKVCRPPLSQFTEDLGQAITWSIDDFWSSDFNYEITDFTFHPWYLNILRNHPQGPWQGWEDRGSADLFSGLQEPWIWSAAVAVRDLLAEEAPIDEDTHIIVNKLMGWLWPPIASTG